MTTPLPQPRCPVEGCRTILQNTRPTRQSLGYGHNWEGWCPEHDYQPAVWPAPTEPEELDDDQPDL